MRSPSQRKQVRKRLVGNDDAASVNSHLAVQHFQGLRISEHLLNPLLVIQKLLQVRRFLDRFGKRHFGVVRHGFGDHVAVCGRTAQGARLCLQLPVGSDLRYRILSVFADDIVDHFLAAAFAEVRIKVRRRYAVRVQEPFKEQVVLDRVDIGDSRKVSHQRTGSGTAPGAYWNAVLLRPVDEVPYAQEVTRIFRAHDDAQFIVQTFQFEFRVRFHVLRRIITVFCQVSADRVFAGSVKADFSQICARLAQNDFTLGQIPDLLRSRRFRVAALLFLLFQFGNGGVLRFPAD